MSFPDARWGGCCPIAIGNNVDPFVQQLADLCRAHPTRAKWVLVPSHAIGRTIGERIALEGTNWANLRFVTPLDIAVRMAGRGYPWAEAAMDAFVRSSGAGSGL